MTKVSRDDVFIRSEKGGEWFNEFLRICRDQEEILTAVVAKKSEGVAEVVQQYREMVGLDLVKSASSGIKENEQGGFDYADSEQETARKVDLITLPSNVEGTNCSNCKFVKITNADKGQGFCEHELVQLPVTAKMCCALWDNAEVKRNWNKAEASHKLSNRSIENNKPAVETKTSKAGISFLSLRHAKNNAVSILENSPELKIMIDSFCEGSGGTKSTLSIINFLREKLGHELVRFSDQELKDYIAQRKEHYKEHISEDAAALDVGRIGISPSENFEDQVADYMTHGK